MTWTRRRKDRRTVMRRVTVHHYHRYEETTLGYK